MNRQSDAFINAILSACRERGLIDRGSVVVAALSGGADSVCMLDALCRLRGELDFNIVVAHLDHSTRGEESNADALFAAETAEKYGLKFVCGKVGRDVALPRDFGSLEDTLRRARRKFLSDTANAAGAKHVALAHNRDDQAETVLMRVIRGTSPEGLAAIKPSSGIFIRPLLAASRAEIERYCADNNLAFRTDSSNSDQRFFRNKIRARLLPELEAEYNPHIRERLAALAEIAAEDSDFFEALADEATQKCATRNSSASVSLSMESLSSLPAPVMKRVLRNCAAELLGEMAWALEKKHIDAMAALAAGGEAGRSTDIPGARATRKYASLDISLRGSEPDGSPDIESFAVKEIPCDISVGDVSISFSVQPFSSDMLRNENKDAAYMKAPKIGEEIVVRFRRDGDVFHALGAPGPKKLKDFLIDEKVDRDLRDKTPLVLRDGAIAWVAGVRVGEAFRLVPEADESALVVEVKKR